MTVTRATAPAKLNLSLQVRPKDASGLHPVRGLTQSIGWYDILTMEPGRLGFPRRPRGPPSLR